VRVWHETDGIEIFEHAWVFDHFYPINVPDTSGPCLEGWTLLAAETQRLRLGVMVTGNTYRHPAVLAKMGATVDHISHGRLDFGIGAAWNEQEHTAYGIPLYAPGERIRRFGEACEVIRRLWTEPTVTFQGKYYQLTDARCEPKPVQKPYPPFVIGGSGEKLTLRVVARYANIWNAMAQTPEEFTRKSAILDEHCAAIGRDPATIERSIQLIINPNDMAAGRDTLRGFIQAGVTHIVCYLRPPYAEGIAQHVADEIAQPLRDEFAT
jgi:F420-dependent oxidoreductase-like protein